MNRPQLCIVHCELCIYIEFIMKLNKTIQQIKPSGIREFFDIVSTMPDALSLGVGEPDFITPWYIRDAAIKSVQKGYTSYTSNKGLAALLKEISKYLGERFGVCYDADEEIIVTVGASEAIDLALRVLIEPGDGVLIPSPSYVSYMPLATLCGGRPIPVECSEADGFKLTPAKLAEAAAEGARVLVVPYPNNPTGAIMTEEELSALLPVIEKYDLAVISDEIYAELTYDGTHVSVPSLPGFRERTVLINGFSKAFAMTGWRLGYVAAPADVTAAMLKVHQYTALCAPTQSQYAGLAALKEGREEGYRSVLDMKEEYSKRRRYITGELNALGLTCRMPGGAFYVFANVSSSGMDGQKFARGLLAAEKVAVVPGDAFGEAGKNYVRMSYATSLRTLMEAVKRIKRFLGK